MKHIKVRRDRIVGKPEERTMPINPIWLAVIAVAGVVIAWALIRFLGP